MDDLFDQAAAGTSNLGLGLSPTASLDSDNLSILNSWTFPHDEAEAGVDTAVARALDTVDAVFDDLDNGHITAALRQRRLVDPPARVASVGVLFDEPWVLIWTDEPAGRPHVLYLGPGLR